MADTRGPGPVGGWLDHVLNAEVLREAYGAQGVPEPDGLVIHEVTWHRDGPSLTLRFELPSYPAEPPEAWTARAANTVQVELRLLGARALLDGGPDPNPVGALRLSAGPDGRLRAVLEAGLLRVEATADHAVLRRVSAYTKGGGCGA
ncbi:Imm50 family immunity protein [Streptomyces sp. NPDC127106]|uniref:Imm50 family immunity protein n=1 Tax=Streptomyces sp. NPDC127106 TaxID=3345360 RepID=UPI00362A066D